jgi:hypothetical protein
MFASSYPLLDIFLTTLYFVGLFLFIYFVIIVFMDIFRSHDLSGLAKAAWVILIVLLPFFGILIYLIARGRKMAEHRVQDVQEQEAAFKEYVQQAAGTDTSADQLAKLADLKDRGVLSEAEFEAQKAKILGG